MEAVITHLADDAGKHFVGHYPHLEEKLELVSRACAQGRDREGNFVCKALSAMCVVCCVFSVAIKIYEVRAQGRYT